MSRKQLLPLLPVTRCQAAVDRGDTIDLTIDQANRPAAELATVARGGLFMRDKQTQWARAAGGSGVTEGGGAGPG